MKFRRRPSPLLLLLLPALVTSLSAPAQDDAKSILVKRETPQKVGLDAKPSPVVDISAKTKLDVGTKDAPVDGKDGKPHAGPWVGENSPKKDGKKPKAEVKDVESVLVDEKTKLVTPDGDKIPEVNDGVMDDPHRQLPQTGTTGTEGGVSEKSKLRKEQEVKSGEKTEKKPDSPKEPLPLPHSEQPKVEKSKTAESDVDEDPTVDSLAGLEVRYTVTIAGSC